MNIQVLKIEITSDPDVRGYSGMSDTEVADDLNLVRKNRNLTSMTASEVANSIDNTEWTALTADEQRKIWDVLHMGGTLNPFGIEATIFNNVFGASDTITALQAARIEQISRAVELDLGHTKVGHVQMARIA